VLGSEEEVGLESEVELELELGLDVEEGGRQKSSKRSAWWEECVWI